MLYDIIIDLGIHMNLISKKKLGFTETYNIIRLEKNLSDMFPIRNGLK
jgi:hypothetical protein